MSFFQWIIALVYCLVLPALLALLNRAVKSEDVNDKGLITDSSNSSMLTPREKIESIMRYVIRNRSDSYADEITKEHILQKYTEASGWLFLYEREKQQYNNIPYRLSLDLYAILCFFLALYSVFYVFDRTLFVIIVLSVSIASYLGFCFLFSRHTPKCIPTYHENDYSGEELPLINADSTMEEIESCFDKLIYPHIDRVKEQCSFMDKKYRSFLTARYTQDIIVIILLITEVVFYCITH